MRLKLWKKKKRLFNNLIRNKKKLNG